MTTPTSLPVLRLAGALLACAAASAQSFDAAADFSTTANPSGAWSYGWSASLAAPFQQPTVSGALCSAVGWTPGNYLGVYKNGAPSTCQTAVFPEDTVILHPGNNGQYAVLRWTSPGTGFCTISAAFTGADASFPTSSDVAVLYNGAQLMTGLVDSYAGGVVFVDTINVLAGDRVDFVVGNGPNNTFNGDSTAVDATIEFGLAGSSARAWRGCGNGPRLTTSAPTLGALMQLQVDGALPGVVCALGMSDVPAGSVHLGSRCTLFVDLPTLAFFPFQVTDPAGSCLNALQVPVNGALLHQHFALQSATLPTSTATGFDLSNGVFITLGT